MRCIKGAINDYPLAIEPDVLQKEKAASRDRWFAQLDGAVAPQVADEAARQAHLVTVLPAVGGLRVEWSLPRFGGTSTYVRYIGNLDRLPALLAEIRRQTRDVVLTIEFGNV